MSAEHPADVAIEPTPAWALSRDELNVARLIARGYYRNDVSELLGIPPRTLSTWLRPPHPCALHCEQLIADQQLLNDALREVAKHPKASPQTKFQAAVVLKDWLFTRTPDPDEYRRELLNTAAQNNTARNANIKKRVLRILKAELRRRRKAEAGGTV